MRFLCFAPRARNNPACSNRRSTDPSASNTPPSDSSSIYESAGKKLVWFVFVAPKFCLPIHVGCLQFVLFCGVCSPFLLALRQICARCQIPLVCSIILLRESLCRYYNALVFRPISVLMPNSSCLYKSYVMFAVNSVIFLHLLYLC